MRMAGLPTAYATGFRAFRGFLRSPHTWAEVIFPLEKKGRWYGQPVEVSDGADQIIPDHLLNRPHRIISIPSESEQAPIMLATPSPSTYAPPQISTPLPLPDKAPSPPLVIETTHKEFTPPSPPPHHPLTPLLTRISALWLKSASNPLLRGQLINWMETFIHLIELDEARIQNNSVSDLIASNPTPYLNQTRSSPQTDTDFLMDWFKALPRYETQIQSLSSKNYWAVWLNVFDALEQEALPF